MNKLKLRTKLKRKKPKFERPGEKTFKRVKHGWKNPHGNQSKLRKHKKSRGYLPRPGYGSPKEVRNLHPSGFEEVLVHNVKELEKIDTKKQACRIASKVGKKKGFEIMKKAGEMKIKVFNPLKQEAKNVEKKETKKEKKKV
ncbi:MAG: 50S ribosomal protein L32e [Candidatus Aenigmatarchaeota archaeon]